jgi:hypothetical protein
MTLTRTLLAAGVAVLIPLAGSCSVPTSDRQGPNGAQPDAYQDMTHVVVYRAPDQVPNIAVGCIGAYGFMTTLKNSSDSGSGSAAPSLVRFPEYDRTCGT